MTDVAEDVLRYRRAKPAEWDELIAASEESLMGQENFSGLGPAHIAPVYVMADQLDNETLEANRYYGLGLVMCKFARALQIPELREDTVNESAQDVVTGFRKAGFKTHLRPGDLHFLSMAILPIHRISLNSIDRLSLPERVVTETLVGLAKERREKIQEVHRIEGLDVKGPTKNVLRLILDDDLLAISITANALGGITLLLTGILSMPQSQYERMLRPRGKKWTPIDPARLESLEVRKAAKQTALLRLDEFNKIMTMEQPFSVNGDSVQYTGDHLTHPPAQSGDAITTLTGKIVLHKSRLACPAVQVPGLIDIMSSLVPDIIIRAQGLLAGKSPIDPLPSQREITPNSGNIKAVVI